ncbi:hypothetical protein GGI00_006572, partial [Coemansia sp. RSA 2681]
VWLFTKDEASCPATIQISKEELDAGKDIEQDLVEELARRHKEYISSAQQQD